MTGPIDMASLFSAPPTGPAQNVRFRQGQIVTFDPTTLANTVNVGGAPLVNLPLLGVAEAASLVPGASVGIMVIGDEGARTMFIIGRSVIPNTPDATAAITQVSQGAVTDFVAATETTTSATFTDLATVGPTVSVNVKASGKVLVFLAATCANSNGGGPAAGQLWGAFVNMQISGANSIAPASIPGGLGYSMAGVVGNGPFSEFSITRMIPLTGLTPGTTTFQSKYACLAGTGGETARFRNRSMAVFAL